MNNFEDILLYTLGPFTVGELLEAIALFGLLLAIFYIFRAVVLMRLHRFAEKTSTIVDDRLVQILQEIPAYFYFVLALYFPLIDLLGEGMPLRIVRGIFLVLVIFQAVRVVQHFVEYILMRSYREREGKEPVSETMISGLRLVIRIVLWSVAILLILSNLGIEVSSLVASLGIGGIAVALAAQNILGDLFSSFAIYFDRPFEVGDFIIVGKDMGTVKQIGMKTTRITSLQGEEIVIPNQELTSARIQNFKKMQKRRVVFTLKLVYETSTAKLTKAQKIVQKAIEDLPEIDFDRCHFVRFGDFSLEFDVVYYVTNSDYRVYMDKQMELNLRIKSDFEKVGIEMAFPTQTVYLEK